MNPRLHTLLCVICQQPFTWVQTCHSTRSPLTCDHYEKGPHWKANAKAKRKPMSRLQKDEANYRKKEERRKLRTVNPAPCIGKIIKRVKTNARPYQDGGRQVKTYKPGRRCGCGALLGEWNPGPDCSACFVEDQKAI